MNGKCIYYFDLFLDYTRYVGFALDTEEGLVNVHLMQLDSDLQEVASINKSVSGFITNQLSLLDILLTALKVDRALIEEARLSTDKFAWIEWRERYDDN